MPLSERTLKLIEASKAINLAKQQPGLIPSKPTTQASKTRQQKLMAGALLMNKMKQEAGLIPTVKETSDEI